MASLDTGSVPPRQSSPERQISHVQKVLVTRNKNVRPITSRCDLEGASAVVKRLSGQKSADSAAELRLQALLREMDRFEDTDDADVNDGIDDYGYAGPRRRWSDDGATAD